MPVKGPVTAESITQANPATARTGAVWSGINTVVTKLAGIFITALVVRIVTPHDFGVFAAALIVHTIITSFGELGVSACIARRDLKLADVAPTVSAISIASGIALAAAMVVTADQLAVLLGAPDAADPIRVLAISVFLTGLLATPGAMLVRDFRQHRLFMANLAAFVPSNALLVFLALDGDGAMAFAWSRVVGQVCVGIVLFASARPMVWPRISSRQLRFVLGFGLPLAGANLLGYTLLNADFAFIGRILGPALLGTYVLAFNVASWATSVLGSSINSVAMSAMSEIRSDPAHLRQTLSRWMRLVCLLAFPICAMTMALADDLVGFLYGPKWEAAAPVLSILSIYGAIFTVSLLLSNLLVAAGRTGRVFLVQAMWLATLVPAVILGIMYLGLEGVAWAHVAVVTVVVLPAYFWAVRPVLPGIISIVLKAGSLPLTGALLAGAGAFLASQAFESHLLGLIAGGAAGSLIYFALVMPALRAYLPNVAQGVPGQLLKGYDTILNWRRGH